MKLKFDDKEYQSTRGSDIDRDGMFLELAESDLTEPILSAFYNDQSHKMTFCAHATDMPFEMIEWFVTEAKRQLPPLDKT